MKKQDQTEKSIMDKVKSVDDVIRLSKPSKEEIELIEYKGSNKRMIAARASLVLFLLAELLNEGWKPDWNNWDEYKYTPWFERNKDSSGFSYDYYFAWTTFSIVGSRLYYRSSTLAKYAGQQFIELYNDLLQYED